MLLWQYGDSIKQILCMKYMENLRRNVRKKNRCNMKTVWYNTSEWQNCVIQEYNKKYWKQILISLLIKYDFHQFFSFHTSELLTVWVFFTFLCHADGKIGHFCTTLWPQWDPLYIMQRCYFWQFFCYTIGIWEKVHAYFSWLARMCVLCINANCLFQNTVVTNSYVWKYLLLIWWVYKFMTSLNLCCNHSHYFYRCKHG